MFLDFNDIPVRQMDRFKGGEKYCLTRMFDDGRCKIMHGTLVPGASIGLHTHEDSCEIIYCLSGCGTEICDGVTEILRPGTVHYCPKGHSHTLRNEGEEDLVFVAVVPKQ